MRTLRTICASAILQFGVMTSLAAAPVVTDLSEHVVGITANFAGSDILLFGATQGESDVIVIVRGPRVFQTVRRKERRAGIWINGDSVTFERIPSFYAVAATRPPEELLSDEAMESYGIGTEHLILPLASETPQGIDSGEFTAALIRNMRNRDLYSDIATPVKILGNSLFRVGLHFPTNVPVGSFDVRVLLVRDGEVVSTGTTHLEVGKTGVEAGIYDLAHRYPPAYGVISIIIAIGAGWLASVAFRKA